MTDNWVASSGGMKEKKGVLCALRSCFSYMSLIDDFNVYRSIYRSIELDSKPTTTAKPLLSTSPSPSLTLLPLFPSPSLDYHLYCKHACRS